MPQRNGHVRLAPRAGGTATPVPRASATEARLTPRGQTPRGQERKDWCSASPPSATPSRRRSQRIVNRSSNRSSSNPVSLASDDHVLGTRSHDGGRANGLARLAGMASSAAKWREEQILIICPGSRTTMAQLGCSELTPPLHRLPTRMFRDGDEWRPYHTYKRSRLVGGVEQVEWVEDVDSDEGAVFPIEGGRIVHMDSFLAFLDHVHGMLASTYHNTPIMLMASPQWTRPDCETIAQYIFEKTRTPALCLIHSGIATQYGLRWPSMTVVDIGYEKVDVTAIHDGRVVNHMDLGSPNPDRHISGGQVFTQRLLKLLEAKGFNHDMAEQLKRSAICEVLPYAPAETALAELPREDTAGAPPALAVPATTPGAEAAAAGEAPKPPEVSRDDDGENAGNNGDEDGVLDVAAIVTSGQTKEFLAKKEKEKGKPGRKAKDKEGETGAAKLARLPNCKRTHNTFFFEEVIQEEVPREPKPDGAAATNGGEAAPPAKPADETPAGANGATTEQPRPEPSSATAKDTPETRPKRIRRDVEVGLERFTFAERAEIDRIVATIYRTIQGIDDMYMRPACWDNLVFVGNGARLRGLRENILQTLQARHIISPSTATMFTSELPSNMATPSGTGSQTPTGSFTGMPHQLPSSGVNPLLQAATTASTLAAVGGAGLGGAAAAAAAGIATTPAAGQTPTSIKTAALPTYLSEWSKNGFEEAMFLGAQVAARIAFCIHSNMDAQGVEAQRLMSLSRVDYNELGPKAIRTHSMLS
ncbi:actin domain-containing protein [Hirsutella rhossiliensis]|uniref:Actin domain-containing protein n=1 Tax=Hirsutella rhossiliensis TaxID=111463 RepID=A0A9P8SLZ6_9HYPO|nr:actin domain-containing protein [Hirsutella rhossiliensis]KAH0965661.1 actin domain-containing protein [Hirsutella rhossiliensis]